MGSTVNIARMNTEAIAAHQSAKFAEIAQEEISMGHIRHVFATAAYQSYPEKAIYVSISEIEESQGSWANDRSHAFSLTTTEFADGGYVEPIYVRRNRVQSDPEHVKFEVFLVDETRRLYRTEMVMRQDVHRNWVIVDAVIHRSPQMQMDLQIKKLVLQPEHLVRTNEHWPEFYLFMTRTPAEQLQNGDERVSDGLMFSENRFRYNKFLSLMNKSIDGTELFKSSLWGALPGMIYSDSTIMVENDES